MVPLTPLALAATLAPLLTHAQSGNPFEGRQIYANPYYAAEIEDYALPELSGELADAAREVAETGTFAWLDTRAKVPTVAEYLENIQELNAAGADPEVMGAFVVYNLPDRDCSASASNGELAIADDGVAKYKAYVDEIAESLAAYPDVTVALVIEPDSLANLVTNLDVPKCAAAAPYYREATIYALQALDMPHVTQYLDGAHAGWLGWEANLAPTAQLFGEIYAAAGEPASVRGLATDVSNFNAWSTDSCPAYTTPNQNCDEKRYINALAPLLQQAGFPARFIVDVGRSGEQPTGQDEWGHWCNARGTGFGRKPTTETGDVLADALVWVKPGGESDGTSDRTAERFDEFCGSSSSVTPAPEAGTWFQAYFEMLLENRAF